MSAGQRWWCSEPSRRNSRDGLVACEGSCRPANFEEDTGLAGLDDCEKTHGRDRESGKRRRRRGGGEEDQNSTIKQRTVWGGGCSLGCSRPCSPRMGIMASRGVIRLILAVTILGLLAWSCEGQTAITALSPINGPPTGKRSTLQLLVFSLVFKQSTCGMHRILVPGNMVMCPMA